MNKFSDSDRKLHTEIADYRLTKGGVLYTYANPVDFTDDNIRDNYVQLKEFLNGQRVMILSNTTNTQPYDKKHRLAFEKQAEEFALAIALTANSVVGNAVANIFVAMINKPIPIKFFRSEEKALDWLMEHGKLSSKMKAAVEKGN